MAIPSSGTDVRREGRTVPAPPVRCHHETPVEHAVVLKHDRWFVILDAHGDISPPGHCAVGLFRDDTRMLSHYTLRMCGGPPSLLSSQLPRTYAARLDMAIGDEEFGGSRWDPKSVVHVRRELLLEDELIERVSLTSFLPRPLEYWIELEFGSDFADIFEVRGWRRDERGVLLDPIIGDDQIALAYRGRDDVVSRTLLHFRTPPTELRETVARWELLLQPQERQVLEWKVSGEAEGHAGGRTSNTSWHPMEQRRHAIDATYDDWRQNCSVWRSNDADFDDVMDRATTDLRALYVTADGGEAISAGIPWYSTVFGRDSIITALQTLPLCTRIAVDTLRYLAERQGRSVNAYTEEEPGKILHEIRRGELARGGEIPHVPYYGSVDATPLWLVLLHETWRWTADVELVRELLPAAERALEWIDRFGDRDGDGFVEYERTSEKGLVHQGWKDSGDGVPFPDGQLPSAPIALVEVQGYVYDAKVRMASLYAALGDDRRAGELRQEAFDLRQRILDRFWMEELGTFALALDGAKNLLPTVTSNAGHLLWSRVPAPPEAERLARTLLSDDMFSGWGIRTLSAAHGVYNPMSYHNGSVWPHDNALIVLGLALYGDAAATLPVLDGLRRAAIHAEHHRLPELFCGMQRTEGLRPVAYPVSCSPQAWASGAFFMMLQAVLGILPDAPARVLHIRNPVLPSFLDVLVVSGLRVGASQVDLQFRRHGGRTLVNLLEVSGEPLQVRIELT